MPASLIGNLTPDGKSIALLVAGADDFELPLIGGRLDYLTAQWTIPDGAPDIMLVPCTWPTVIQLGRMFAGPGSPAIWRPGESLIDWITAEHVRRRGTPPPLPEDAVPPWLKLRDYQRDDAAAIAAAGKALVLHEPGLGKTSLTIAGLEARRLAGNGIFPMIICVPSWIVGRVWTDHIAQWAPGWPEPVLHKGTDRIRTLAWLKQERHRDYILITTYATLRMDAPPGGGPLTRLMPETAIADEAHMVAGDSAQAKAFSRIARHAPQVLQLSGTLITHSMKNIYPVLKAMDRESWPSWDRTKHRYIATRRADHDGGEDVILGLRPEMEDEFFACLDGQVARRITADVLPELPELIYSVRRPVMPPEWRRAYDTMRDQMLAELPDGGELPVIGSLAQLTRLSQLASSATDVRIEMVLNPDTGEYVPHYHVTLKRPSWKADAFLGLMAERGGRPTVVFAESRQLVMITGEDCITAGLRTGFITGPGGGPQAGPGYRITPGTCAQAERDFQAGKLDVIACTSQAGGFGITLTAGNCAAMLQRSFKLDDATQPEKRVHRIGSEIHAEHGVEITDFVTEDTVDQHRRDVLKDKGRQAAQFYRDPRYMRMLLGGLK